MPNQATSHPLRCFVLFLCCAGVAPAQTEKTTSAASELQHHYDSAQRLQQSGELDRAAQEYRLFLAQALGALGTGEAHLGQPTKAAASFDEALSLDPNSASARLDYAQAELNAGSLSHAEALSREALQAQSAAPQEIARAHEILGRTLLRMNRDQDARKELETAATLEPSFDHSYNLAVACLDLDDAACASRIFAQIQTAYGDTPAIHMDIGRAWGQSDFQPRAEDEFRKVIAEDPKFPGAHYCLAATYLQENQSDKLKDAQAELEKELTVSPGDFLTYAALGKLAASQQQDAAAARYLHHAIQLNPANPDAWLYLGQMEFNNSQWTEAEAALRRAIVLTPDPSRNRYQIQKAHYLLGRILMRQGREQEASAEMKIAQSFLQHDLKEDRSKLTGMLGAGGQGMGDTNSTVAIAASAAASDQPPNPAEVRRFEAFQKEIAPPLAESYNNLGIIAAVQKDYSSATNYFEKAASWNPSLEGINLNWGRAAFSASRFADAVKPLTLYLRAHPGEQNIRAVLGISQFMVHDYRGCLATLQPVESKLDAVPQVAYVYADSLAKTGRRSLGLERLLALEKKNPEVPDVHRALGEAFAAGAENQKAIGEFREAIRLNPQDHQAQQELQATLLDQQAAQRDPQRSQRKPEIH